MEAELRADGRAGAKAILQSVAERRTRNRAEGQRLRGMMHMEKVLRSKGILHVAGVDEAGMSPLAGPVAAAAVILPAGLRIAGINDSKQLDAASREEIAVEIKTRAIAWSVAYADVEEIDTDQHLLGRHPCDAARGRRSRTHAAAPPARCPPA